MFPDDFLPTRTIAFLMDLKDLTSAELFKDWTYNNYQDYCLDSS